MSSVNPIYVSDSKNEFISRELGWKRISRLEFEQSCQSGDLLTNLYVFAIGSNLGELRILQKLPRKSIIVHLYADETYAPMLNFKLLRLKSVAAVIRSYPIEPQSILQLQKNFLISIQRNLGLVHFRKFRKYLQSLVAGQILVLRQMFIQVLHKSSEVQLIRFMPGYTNLFATSLMKVTGLSDNGDSILVNVHLRKFVSEGSRTKEITFIGQSGSYWRQNAIESASKIFGVKKGELEFFQIRENFGGTLGANGASLQTGMEYVKDLLNSQFSLCPPGNYSNNTFRYCESLICGSIPIIAEGSPCDPSFRALFGPALTCRKESWPKLLKQVKGESLSALEVDSHQMCLEISAHLQGISKSLSIFHADLKCGS